MAQRESAPQKGSATCRGAYTARDALTLSAGAGIVARRDRRLIAYATVGWDGRMIADAVKLAQRVANGETPKHRLMQLG